MPNKPLSLLRRRVIWYYCKITRAKSGGVHKVVRESGINRASLRRATVNGDRVQAKTRRKLDNLYQRALKAEPDIKEKCQHPVLPPLPLGVGGMLLSGMGHSSPDPFGRTQKLERMFAMVEFCHLLMVNPTVPRHHNGFGQLLAYVCKEADKLAVNPASVKLHFEGVERELRRRIQQAYKGPGGYWPPGMEPPELSGNAYLDG